MKKIINIIGLLSIVLTLSVTTEEAKETINENNNKKVKICHKPPGNPKNVQTIEVSKKALKAHLDHGDSIGDCKNDNAG